MLIEDPKLKPFNRSNYGNFQLAKYGVTVDFEFLEILKNNTYLTNSHISFFTNLFQSVLDPDKSVLKLDPYFYSDFVPNSTRQFTHNMFVQSIPTTSSQQSQKQDIQQIQQKVQFVSQQKDVTANQPTKQSTTSKSNQYSQKQDIEYKSQKTQLVQQQKDVSASQPKQQATNQQKNLTNSQKNDSETQNSPSIVNKLVPQQELPLKGNQNAQKAPFALNGQTASQKSKSSKDNQRSIPNDQQFKHGPKYQKSNAPSLQGDNDDMKSSLKSSQISKKGIEQPNNITCDVQYSLILRDDNIQQKEYMEGINSNSQFQKNANQITVPYNLNSQASKSQKSLESTTVGQVNHDQSHQTESLYSTEYQHFSIVQPKEGNQFEEPDENQIQLVGSVIEYVEDNKGPPYFSALSSRIKYLSEFYNCRSNNPVTEKEFAYIPINLSNSHWICVMIFNKLGTIQYLDSLNNKKQDIVQNIQKLVTYESKNNYYTIKYDSPRQENGFDCGVFIIKAYLELLSRKRIIQYTDYDQVEITKFRHQLLILAIKASQIQTLNRDQLQQILNANQYI